MAEDIKAESSDRKPIPAFLQGLEKLTLMEGLIPNKDYSTPVYCSRCEKLSQSWSKSKLKWKEVQDGARIRDCPLCQLIVDSLPGMATVQDAGVNHSRGISPGRQESSHAILKRGRLDEFMDEILRIGAPFEDRNTGSDCAFQMAAAWMKTCVTKHAKCRAAKALSLSLLPSRVIDVGPSDGSQDPKLHLGGTDRGLYFTLSYRWNQNSDAAFQTVKSNLEAYKFGIPLQTLPQTMQDAILVTRRFGIQYLWIDAICIIQDSVEDWQAEANAMAGIYKNSLLTIAAAVDAKMEADGCFRARSRLQTRPFNTDTQSQLPVDFAKYIFADRRISQDASRPLMDTRAWVLQEQLLSPRVLSYSSQELYWDCVSLNASETFPNGLPGFYDVDMKLMDLRYFKESILVSGGSFTGSDRFYNSWRKVVEEYSARKMTKETDKLAALMGVVKEVSSVMKDEFLAGLWKLHLGRELLWWVKEPEKSSRPQTFQAPSWSWSSLNAAISFELRGRDDSHVVGRCISFRSHQVESDQTLPVISGKIVVRGKIFAMMQERPPSDPLAGLSPPSWREDIGGTDLASVKCLLVLATEHYMYALGLVAVNDEETEYKRVGLVDWRADPKKFGYNLVQGTWDDEQDLRNITIW